MAPTELNWLRIGSSGKFSEQCWWIFKLVKDSLLTPELKPSAQRYLTRFFTQDFASLTVHFVNTCVKNQQIHQLFIKLINYVWYLLNVSALNCHHQGVFLVRSQIATNHATRHNTPIHNILSTAPQLIISQKALGTLPDDGNVMPKHVGDTIHN
jgi:hypothetical protein